MSLKRLPVFFCLILLVGSMATSAAGQEVFADWTSLTTFDLGPITVTGSTSNQVNAVDQMFNFGNLPQDGEANYPDVWFSPTPPVGILWSIGIIGNTAAGSVGSNDVTLDFSVPVVNPRFHFVNVDNATIEFTGLSPDRLSGNVFFEVTGPVVNSTTAGGPNPGCADDLGGNPLGGCGTVEFKGTYSSITFTATDTSIGTTGSGDGFGWTVSANPSLSVLSIPTASDWGLIILSLLLAGSAFLIIRRTASF